VGAGVLSRKAATLLLATIVPAAYRALGDGRSPFAVRRSPFAIRRFAQDDATELLRFLATCTL
jgi:hypothetical protein